MVLKRVLNSSDGSAGSGAARGSGKSRSGVTVQSSAVQFFNGADPVLLLLKL